MKIANVVALSLTAAGLLATPSVHAALETFQPASGYVWNGSHDSPAITRIDGQVQANQAVTWVVPVQLSAYNTNFSGSQSTTGVLGGSVSTRLAAFDKDGAFVGATTPTTGTTFGSVFVPINGTLFTQSTFSAGCGPQFCTTATLRSLKVTY